jgi:Flp pilus assembly protein TadD
MTPERAREYNEAFRLLWEAQKAVNLATSQVLKMDREDAAGLLYRAKAALVDTEGLMTGNLQAEKTDAWDNR